VRRQQSARSCQPASVRGHSAVVRSRTFATGVLPWQVVTPSRRQRWLAAAIKMAIASSAPVSQSRITGKPAAAGPASAAAAAVVRWLAMIAARLADTALLATRCIAPSGHSSRPPAARCCGRTGAARCLSARAREPIQLSRIAIWRGNLHERVWLNPDTQFHLLPGAGRLRPHAQAQSLRLPPFEEEQVVAARFCQRHPLPDGQTNGLPSQLPAT
jgi:hypothetical protein